MTAYPTTKRSDALFKGIIQVMLNGFISIHPIACPLVGMDSLQIQIHNNMKTFYISSEHLPDILPMLWDECATIGARVNLDPVNDSIQIVKNNGVVALVTPLVVSDEYDLRRELKDM